MDQIWFMVHNLITLILKSKFKLLYYINTERLSLRNCPSAFWSAYTNNVWEFRPSSSLQALAVVSLFVVVVQSLSRVWLFAAPWTAAHQASLSFTVSQSLLKLMSTELVIPSNHFILCHPFSSCPQFSQHQSLVQWVNSSHQVVKVLEFQLQHQSFQWIFRVDFL